MSTGDGLTSVLMFPIRRNAEDQKQISVIMAYSVLREPSVCHCRFKLYRARRQKAVEHRVEKILFVTANRPARDARLAVYVTGTQVAFPRFSTPLYASSISLRNVPVHVMLSPEFSSAWSKT
jgi:hypothetical protein